MNDLNNQQLLLLAILVSFVTSIATGIFTVTLIDQAPQGVTQTIDRVVERTVEVILPQETETIVRERVVVDRSGEVVVSAIKRSTPAVADIVSLGTGDGNSSESLSATGTPQTYTRTGVGFIGTDGMVITSAKAISSPGSYAFSLYDKDGNKELLPITIIGASDDINVAVLKVDIPDKLSFSKLALSEDALAVGQTAIVLDSQSAAVSFISGVFSEDTSKKTYRLYFEDENQIYGRPVINVKEEVIGILDAGGRLIPASAIKEFISSINSADDSPGSTKDSPRDTGNVRKEGFTGEQIT